ncbi:5'-deoxynucleotidase YfbR [bioreactor metagenome]|uniref:5'-deoxynucleotidase YfbR n=1 Tax=bioreactor metagenome TaxID=1076179 RepID=A0A645D4R3_9ZZZZ|nr:5'-deoxynucleotidase [Oscillospiraceae bacterium]
MDEGNFLALLFRMKNIKRWGLMYNTRSENLAEHSLECAFVAHALAVIGNTRFSKQYDPEKIATSAMFHDVSEIITGDLPTPVKYFNDDIKTAYKKIEKTAESSMLSLLDDLSRPYYLALTNPGAEEHIIIKAADKLCAYIKCRLELSRGNPEFESAAQYIRKNIDTMDCCELQYFMDHYFDSFIKSIDELSVSL